MFKIIWTKLLGFLAAILALFNLTLPCLPTNPADTGTAYPHVLVNGLMGWGSYEFYNELLPYWGMLSGDMLLRLGLEGYECYAASVDGTGSTWDRACELYAQLTGTRTDYGAAHAAALGHARYGKDYTGKALLQKAWSAENKLNLYGHSFGGATIRMLAWLMAEGSAAEQAATPDGSLSPLFAGGKGDWIYSVTGLSAPHNGTSAYEAAQWAESDGTLLAELKLRYNAVDPTGVLFDVMVGLCSQDGEILPDTAHYELTIDGAAELNRQMGIVPGIYYFSVATVCTTQQADGTWAPAQKDIEPLFYTRSIGIGKTMFTTPGGTVVDEAWLPNDGLVNVISAHHPFAEPHTDFDPAGNTSPAAGIWNVLPDFWGDHTSLMGDLLLSKDQTAYFEDLFALIDAIPA